MIRLLGVSELAQAVKAIAKLKVRVNMLRLKTDGRAELQTAAAWSRVIESRRHAGSGRDPGHLVETRATPEVYSSRLCDAAGPEQLLHPPDSGEAAWQRARRRHEHN